MNDGIFDPTQHSPSTGVQGGLPVSDANGHVVTIVSTEIKPTNAGDGTLLQLNMEIQESATAQKGITGSDRLNIGNKNPTTVQIAMSELAAYCAVTGITQAFNMYQDSNILCNKPFRVIVGPQNNDSGYTEVKEVRFLDGRKANQVGQAGGGSMPTSMPAAQPQTASVQPMAQPAQAPQAQPMGLPQGQPPQFGNQVPQQQPMQPQQQPQGMPAQQPLQQPQGNPTATMPWNQPPPQGA